MSEQQNYYEILGVSKDSTTQQVRDSYREIARVYHPDSNFYNEILEEIGEQIAPNDASEKFKIITAAYNVLVHDEKRKLYNETLPPELNTWEEEKPKPHTQWVNDKIKSSGVYAMGQFGRGERETTTPPPPGEEYVDLRSINEVDRSSRNQLLLWVTESVSRILSPKFIFGSSKK